MQLPSLIGHSLSGLQQFRTELATLVDVTFCMPYCLSYHNQGKQSVIIIPNSKCSGHHGEHGCFTLRGLSRGDHRTLPNTWQYWIEVETGGASWVQLNISEDLHYSDICNCTCCRGGWNSFHLNQNSQQFGSVRYLVPTSTSTDKLLRGIAFCTHLT